MLNGEHRQSAAHKSPDPSTKPYPGALTPNWSNDGDGIDLSFDEPVSSNGLPLIRCYLLGELLSGVPVAMVQDEDTWRVEFSDSIAGCDAIEFAPRDPCFRGTGGQYVTPARLTPSTGPLTIIAAEADIGALETTLYLTFSRDVEIFDTTTEGNIWALNREGTYRRLTANGSTQIASNKIALEGVDEDNGNAGNTFTSSGLGLFIRAQDNAEPAPDVTAYPITQL